MPRARVSLCHLDALYKWTVDLVSNRLFLASFNLFTQLSHSERQEHELAWCTVQTDSWFSQQCIAPSQFWFSSDWMKNIECWCSFFISAEIGACKLLAFNLIHMKPSFLVCLSRSKCFMHIIIITCQYFPHQCLWQWCHHRHLRDAVLCSHSAFCAGIKTVAVLTSNGLNCPQINLLLILWIGNKLWNKHGWVTHPKKTQRSLEAVTSKLILFFVVVFFRNFNIPCL